MAIRDGFLDELFFATNFERILSICMDFVHQLKISQKRKMKYPLLTPETKNTFKKFEDKTICRRRKLI